MGQNVYLKDEPYNLLQSIQSNMSDYSQSELIQRALKEFDEANNEKREEERHELLFPRFTISPVPRVRIDSNEELDAPEQIGEWERYTAQYPPDAPGREISLAYQSDNFRLGLIDPEEEYVVRKTERGTEDVISEQEFDNLSAAMSELNAHLAPIGDTPVTHREYQIWWLTDDYSYKEAAELLDIGIETVRTHMTNLSAKRKNAEKTVGLLIKDEYRPCGDSL